MNTRHPTPNDTDDAFDRAMRQRHLQALHALPPSTAGALRAARRTALAPSPRAAAVGPAWRWAGAFAAVAALALGLRFIEPAPVTEPVPQVAAVASEPELDAAIGVLDENPDLYLWLAANDDLPPIPEP